MTSEQETVAEILDQAADVIETRGWIRENYYRAGEGFCAVGALRQAVAEYHRSHSWRPLSERCAIGEAVEDEILRHIPGSQQPRLGRLGSVVAWNDTLARDKFEVVDLFRAAAKDVRNQMGEQHG